MIRLHGFPAQNTLKTLYVLEELGMDYEFKRVKLEEREQKTEAFLKMSPIGKVPVLQHGDDAIFESGAICRYLANLENSPLYPSTPLERAKVDQWMDFFSCHLGRWLTTLFYETVMKKRYSMGAPHAETVEEADRFAHQQLGILNQWLSQNTYLAGGALSIADLFAFAYVEQVKDIGFSLADYPKVQAWMDEINQRESIQRARAKVSETG